MVFHPSRWNLGVLISSLWMLTAVNILHAGDWPQILGPQRNGQAEQEKISTDWPKNGPAELWQREVGPGNAGVAVVGSKLILWHHVNNDDVVEGLDAQTGKPLWATPFPSRSKEPACTPLIHNDRVILVGNDGGLHCVALDTGKELWSRALLKDFHAPAGYFGIGSTPIVVGENLLMNVGGEAGSGIVAFSLKDGETVWKMGNEQASYSSPILVQRNGVSHVIFITRLNVLSLNPAKGEVRFQFPFGKRGPTVNAASPLLVDDRLFLTANYGVGAVWAKFTDTSVETVWENDDTLSSQYPSPVLHNGFVYGIHGRDDVGVAELRCIAPTTGKVAWIEKDFGMATFIVADDKLLIQRTDGELIVARPTAEAFRPIAKAKVLNTLTRALPALSNGLYFVRDTQTLKCFDLRGQK